MKNVNHVHKNPAMKKGGTKLKAGTMDGLSMVEAIDSNPVSEGMGTKGTNQMPLPTAKKKVGGGFEIC